MGVIRNQKPVTREQKGEMGEFRFDFEDLKVYQKSLDFIDKIFKVYKSLDSEYKYSIGSNLVRAGLSIANNLAEGNGKRSKKEKIRYFDTSSDSTRECVSVFNVLKRQNMIDKQVCLELRIDAREITSMIKGLTDSQ